jgi:hypothetical protein
MKPACRSLIAGLFALPLALAGAERPPPPAEAPLTIIPFQTATFFGDPEAGRILNELAEFSTQLLYWTDMPRTPITQTGQVVKGSLMPFYDEWRGANPGAPRLTSAVIAPRITNGYRELTGPRLARIVVDGKLQAEAPRALDAFAGEDAVVPVIVDNRSGQPVTVEISSRDQAEPRRIQLAADSATGVLLRITGDRETFNVRSAGRTANLECVVRRHAPARIEVEILDENGSPTAARVYLTGGDRRAHAPAKVMNRIVTGDCGQPFAGDCYFYADGGFTATVPRGSVALEVVKGMEYDPVVTSFDSSPGRATVRLKRRANLRAQGWYSADVHVHSNLFAQTTVGPEETLLAAKAEDLNVINILPCNDPRTTTITDKQHFTGGPHPVSEKNHIVYFNEEMRNDLYGHVGFLGLKTFVEPAYFGWPHSPFPHDYPGNFPQTLAAKRQGAAVTYVHPALPSEFPVDIALGLADTLDVMSQNAEDLPTEYWYRLLNCGFRVPISAGTDSFLNIPAHLIPGAGRVYVNLRGAEFTYDSWLDGYLKGRSFATNGPLLEFSVNGKTSGDELEFADATEIEIHGSAKAFVPMEALEIVVNGETVKRVAAGNNAHDISLSARLRVDRSAWVALRVRGKGHRLAPNDREVYAHTSPVYVTLAGEPVARRADAEFYIQQIDALIARMDSRGNFAHRGQRDEIVAKFREAQRVYAGIAERAGR